MLMVGHGPLEGKIRKEVAQQALKDVHIFGALDEHDAARVIFASDVVVVPGWLGLAVAHALALGVPVVSQRVGEGTVGHPPEAASLVDGVTGRWAAPGGPEELAVSISQVIAEKAAYATRAARYADQELSMDNMVAGFVDAIDAAALTRSKELVHP
jgi:glycosyltransferase involved in cell wall biosynthesis